MVGYIQGNFYGTPKPPAEPSPFQPDPVDQVLFDNDFDPESQRKRTTSVSKMEKMDSSLPEEEEEEEKEAVNGSGGTGQYLLHYTLWSKEDCFTCIPPLFCLLFVDCVLSSE